MNLYSVLTQRTRAGVLTHDGYTYLALSMIGKEEGEENQYILWTFPSTRTRSWGTPFLLPFEEAIDRYTSENSFIFIETIQNLYEVPTHVGWTALSWNIQGEQE